MKTLTNSRPRNLVQVNQPKKSSYFTGMEKPTFLPHEATQDQRQAIVLRTFAAGEAQGAIITPHTQKAYDRYVAGEITLRQAVDQAMSIYKRQAADA